MEKQIIEIIKRKDDYQYVVELTTINSKFEPQVSVKVRTDDSVKGAGKEALEQFLSLRKKL